MKAIRILLACIRKADQQFDLFHNGDKVVIGVSGGKDSIALTYCLNLYRKFSHINFTIQPVILDLGFDNFDATPIKEFMESIGLSLIVHDSKEVYPILKANTKNHLHLPCSICSRMKKAAINKVANEIGFNKVAFAHHADDAIETLIMNEIYGKRIATFSPMMHLENANIDFIRPFIYVFEKDIKRLIKEENLPVFGSHCPADKHTTREDIKNILNDLYHRYDGAQESFLNMLENYEHEDLWGKEIYLQINQDGLTLKPVINKDDAISLYNIRHQVFTKGQNISYEDEFVVEEEKEAKSFLLCLNKKPIGAIRYRLVNNECKIERFAILEEYQHKGYGFATIKFFTEYLYKRFNPTPIVLNSQCHLVEFYKKAGFIPAGEPFIEAGIKHIRMIYKSL